MGHVVKLSTKEITNLNLNPGLKPIWSKSMIKIKSMIKNEAEP